MKKLTFLTIFLFIVYGLLLAGNLRQQSSSYAVIPFGAKATASQNGHTLGNVLDGNTATTFESPWSNYTLPDTLYFYFAEIQRIDSLTYYPRTDGGYNGNFGVVQIDYSTNAASNTFVNLMNYDFGFLTNYASTAPVKVALNGANGILNPSCIRMIVKSGYGNYASCGEMTFSSTVQNTPTVITSCDPGHKLGSLPADEKKTIVGATTTSIQPGSDNALSNSYDGITSTFYHSNWAGGDLPITIDYDVTGADQINNLTYTPRPGGGNGSFGNTEILYSTIASPSTFTKICDYDFGQPSVAVKCVFPISVVTPAKIRIIVKSSTGGFASCAEMAFYKSYSYTVPSGIFKDNLCSWISPSVTQANIDAMSTGFYKNLAQCMLNQTYDTLYRVQSYEPYSTLATLATSLKTSNYSQFENPTGIYFAANDTAVVMVGDTYNQSISMRVYDYDTEADYTYSLKSGVNLIPIASKGLGYINYYTDNYASLQPVKIHIASGGQINRYYDITKSTAADWRLMLTHAASDMIDLKGNHIGMVYPVQYLKMYCPEDGKKLVQIYDTIVRMEHEMMGLYKYNRIPKNHMYAEADNAAEFSWYGGTLGAHFSSNIYSTIGDNTASMDIWGIAHELGHINQIRPGIRFNGVTEVTNNIYSSWISHSIKPGPYNHRLETDYVRDGYYDGNETGTGYGLGNYMYGGMMNAYLNNTVRKKELWLYSYGDLSMKTSGTEDWNTIGGDFFSRLAPLWQLVLYYKIAHPEKKEWFANVAEKVRTTDETSLTDTQIRLNFIKNICDAVQEDLTDFFQKAGMLRVYNSTIDDYGTKSIIISAADSTATVNYIKSKGYPTPATPYIYYVCANNINAYANNLPVQGSTPGTGCVYTSVSSASNGYQNYVTVDNSVWKNVAVFKTYAGTSVSRLSMVGTGYPDNSKTRVYYPSDATSIYAVAYDGTETLVYPTNPATGIRENSNLNISISPNPVKDGFYVNGINEKASVKLMDMCGRQILSTTISSNDFVNVKTFPKGIYYLSINTGKDLVQKTIIKN